MRVRIPLLASLIVVTIVLAIPLTTRSVRALPGKAVDDPGNTWSPAGPYAPGQAEFPSRLLLKYYDSPSSEFNAFIAGKLDITDWPQPKASFNLYDGNPDFQLTPNEGQTGVFGIYWNAADDVFSDTGPNGTPTPNVGPWWGCNWNTGTIGTTTRQTYVTQCGIEMRQAFAHLLDKPAFVRDVLGGIAGALADPSSPDQDPSHSSHTEQCSWDTIAGTTVNGHSYPSNCISSFNFSDDPGGFARPGSLDFCAAAQHMINAGISTGMNSDCTLTGHVPNIATLVAHPLKAMIRNNDPRRLPLGNGLLNAINQLFGPTVAFPTYGTIQTLGPIVFSEFPEGSTSDWSFYTFGHSGGGPIPDILYDLYSTESASDYCGGPNNPEPDNPTFVCIGQIVSNASGCTYSPPPATLPCTFEQDVVAASQSADISVFRSATLAAFHEYGSRAADLATYSIGIRIAALTSVAGLVNWRGTSYTNPYTMLNAHEDPNYTPANPIYAFGGGDPSTLRWGQSEIVTHLNIFHADTVWDFQALTEVYDTLFQVSPIEAAKVFCWMCNVDSNNGFLGPTPRIDPVTGDAHFLIELKNNLYWHDGLKVDAFDAAFSLLALRDSAPTAGGALHFLKGVHVLTNTSLDVEFTGNSISFPIELDAFVIPRHVWECTSDNTCAASFGPRHADYVAAGVLEPSIIKRSSNYDPVANGDLIGSGPFVCVSLSGVDMGNVGTGCVSDSSGARYDHQNIPVGGTMQLQSYDFARNPGNTNPYYQYMRSVDTNWGTGSNPVAAESGQFNEFKYADFDHNAQVDSSDIARIAICVGATGPSDPAHTLCTNEPGNGYTYWSRSVFQTVPGTISGEFAVVQGQFGMNYVQPFAWNTASLENIAVYP